jgi:hypothetical protein
VKDYLVSKGVPAEDLRIRAEGKDKQTDMKKVEALQAQDEQKPEKWMTKRDKTTWLAFNRRVDIVLEPTGQQSTQSYPNDVPNARLLWQRPEPSLKAVASASQTHATAQQVAARQLGK